VKPFKIVAVAVAYGLVQSYDVLEPEASMVFVSSVLLALRPLLPDAL